MLTKQQTEQLITNGPTRVVTETDRGQVRRAVPPSDQLESLGCFVRDDGWSLGYLDDEGRGAALRCGGNWIGHLDLKTGRFTPYALGVRARFNSATGELLNAVDNNGQELAELDEQAQYCLGQIVDERLGLGAEADPFDPAY